MLLNYKISAPKELNIATPGPTQRRKRDEALQIWVG